MSVFRESYRHIKNLPPAFWVVTGATLMNQVGNMAVVFLVLYLNQSLGYSLAAASFEFAVFSASMLVTGLFGSSIIDRIGASHVMTAAIIFNGLILLLFQFVQNYFVIMLLCLVWGYCFGLYRPASQAYITQLSNAGMHKVTFSVYRLALNLGMSIGPALGGYLASRSFASIFLANGIANLLAAAILIIGLSRTAGYACPSPSLHKPVLSVHWLQRDRVLRWFVIGMIPVSMVFFQHEATLAVYLKRDLHFSLTFYGLLFTLNTLIIVFCELPLNVATMRWPYRINFILGTIFITAGFAGLYFASQTWHILLLTVLWTIGEMILYPASNSYIADIAPEAHRGSYMAIYGTCSNLGMLFGPWSGAVIMEYFGASGLWLMCGVWGMVSVGIFSYLREPDAYKIQKEVDLQSTSTIAENVIPS